MNPLEDRILAEMSDQPITSYALAEILGEPVRVISGKLRSLLFSDHVRRVDQVQIPLYGTCKCYPVPRYARLNPRNDRSSEIPNKADKTITPEDIAWQRYWHPWNREQRRRDALRGAAPCF